MLTVVDAFDFVHCTYETWKPRPQESQACFRCMERQWVCALAVNPLWNYLCSTLQFYAYLLAVFPSTRNAAGLIVSSCSTPVISQGMMLREQRDEQLRCYSDRLRDGMELDALHVGHRSKLTTG